ncbi:hypothetical protein [Bifidobacterium vespertilionis]|uniref:DUF5648 domain-containing protein n=1 Tax=Bifidobacterium vespertilionis TaxID=2562524 RepID=A0A5J5DT62_9BIFI|nr:hypothetical protein [Bifidobacterium vespertilionis]KAA8818382.1 hypothetical protein EMO90_09895 [Bifidobacterium vespertilionis]KAA8822862.1 hypothetical protein EM848_07575 [Bifidobacterium vespertilionis]
MKHIGKALVALAAAIGMAVSGGVATANADDAGLYSAVKITSVKTEDIGSHSVGLKIDYTVDPAYKDQIKSICPIAYMYEVSAVKLNNPNNATLMQGSAGFPWSTECTGILDPDVTPDDYELMFGEHTYTDKYNDGITLDYTGHEWYRFILNAWNTDTRPTSGTFNMTIFGLEPNHFYGNRNVDTERHYDEWQTLLNWAYSNEDKAGQTVNPDIHQFSVGINVEYTDGRTSNDDMDFGGTGAYAVSVPDFTTTAEPAAPGEDNVTGSAKNDVTAQDGDAKPGSTYRLYLKNLSQICKAQLDAGNENPCVWYGYIYSTPTKLTGPDGSPFLEVQKDDKATDPARQYYVDTLIPETVAAGDHKIALTDETGKLQGWTPVTVAKGEDNKPTPEAKRVAVYRLFNPYMTSGTTHLFTTSKAEYDKLVAAGWKGEDVKFHAAGSAADGAKPVYRLYNRWDGSHHFTVDAAEKDNLVKIGWTLEPTTWWAPADGDAKVYRLYNRWNGEHLFTTDKAESDRLAGLGWTVEESGFSVYSQAK